METLTLDAGSNPPTGVASPSKIALFVGNPPRELLIFSGVAIPEWDSKSEFDWEKVVVRLPGTSTEVFQWTSTVSIASITNTDSDFIFAANESWIQVGGDGRLELHVPIGVKGDTSLFSRFSYHVEVLSDPVVSKVSGTIRWNESWGEPTEAAIQGHFSMFKVDAGTWIQIPGASPQFTALAFTNSTSKPVRSSGIWAVSYIIEKVPLGIQLQIIPDLHKSVWNGSPGNPIFTPSRSVTLTPSEPMKVGVDFDMSFQLPPH